MDIFLHIEQITRSILQSLYGAEAAGINFAVEPPRDENHGEMAINAAMLLAKPLQRKPQEIAAEIAQALLSKEEIAQADVAGAGFINIRLQDHLWKEQLLEIISSGRAYGNCNLGKGEKICVEYVSANPTGPMHVGHARGAVVGDALAMLLLKAGYDVTKEYYINDAGSQIEVLAKSAYLRYLEASGEEISIPEGLYPGEYLKSVGHALREHFEDKLQKMDEEERLALIRPFAVDAMMAMIREDLLALCVEHDVFASEKEIAESGKIEKAIRILQDQGLIYQGTLEPPKGKLPEDWEERPQTLFRSSAFGDDSDRPVRKADGNWSYFAPDIAYHFDKFQRGFNQMINIFGADHGGYVKRLSAAVKALSNSEADLKILLCQMVNLMENGQPVKMSKRSGNFVTLRELVEDVGAPVVRFIMLTRKNDAMLDFDLAAAKSQSLENPVFYVQYAHARARSVLRHAAKQAHESYQKIGQADLTRLSDEAELTMIRKMASLPRIVRMAARSLEPHRIAFYCQELAASFHHLWNKGKENADLRFIITEDVEGTAARLCLIRAFTMTLASALMILNIEPIEEM